MTLWEVLWAEEFYHQMDNWVPARSTVRLADSAVSPLAALIDIVLLKILLKASFCCAQIYSGSAMFGAWISVIETFSWQQVQMRWSLQLSPEGCMSLRGKCLDSLTGRSAARAAR